LIRFRFTRISSRIPRMATIHLLVAFALPLLVLSQGQCLPGQTPCKNTCCNTGNNYTCCPYNGGYCAPPDQKCCETEARTGLCPKADSCCETGCATPGEECCGKHICGKWPTTKPVCCAETGTCMDKTDTCCSVPSKIIFSNPSWICPKDTSCCSTITTKQCTKSDGVHSSLEALAQCCNSSTVCCPRSPSTVGTNSAQVKGCDNSKDDRACANPNTEFCCGGTACSTETLCCVNLKTPENGLPFGGGCCRGYPSRSHTCTQVDKNHNLCPDQVEPYLEWKKQQAANANLTNSEK